RVVLPVVSPVKSSFILDLACSGSAAALMAAIIGYRWMNDMTQTPRIVAGERVFAMPTGVVPRGGEAVIPKEQRDVAAKVPNPVKSTPESIALGRERFVTFCTPCHGPEAKGGVSGPVATKFIPPPDLTNADLQRQRTDGYWHSYIVVGGAVMPPYGQAVSSHA